MNFGIVSVLLPRPAQKVVAPASLSKKSGPGFLRGPTLSARGTSARCHLNLYYREHRCCQRMPTAPSNAVASQDHQRSLSCVGARRRGASHLRSSRAPYSPARRTRCRQGSHERGHPTEWTALHINAIMSPIPTKVYKPATVTPRRTSAMTLSGWSLICLPGTALLQTIAQPN